MSQLSKFEWVVVPHTPNSAVFVLSEYWLSGELRRHLGEIDFKKHDVVEVAREQFFDSRLIGWYKRATHNLPE